MRSYKVAAKIDESGGLRLSELPFKAGEEVEVHIVSQEPETSASSLEEDESLEARRAKLPPITRSLLGIAKGAKVDEEDYYRYLEEKYR